MREASKPTKKLCVYCGGDAHPAECGQPVPSKRSSVRCKPLKWLPIEALSVGGPPLLRKLLRLGLVR